MEEKKLGETFFLILPLYIHYSQINDEFTLLNYHYFSYDYQ